MAVAVSSKEDEESPPPPPATTEGTGFRLLLSDVFAEFSAVAPCLTVKEIAMKKISLKSEPLAKVSPLRGSVKWKRSYHSYVQRGLRCGYCESLAAQRNESHCAADKFRKLIRTPNCNCRIGMPKARPVICPTVRALRILRGRVGEAGDLGGPPASASLIRVFVISSRSTGRIYMLAYDRVAARSHSHALVQYGLAGSFRSASGR